MIKWVNRALEAGRWIVLTMSFTFWLGIMPSYTCRALDFQDPVDDLTLSGRNDFGTFNLIKREHFHAGMDVRSAHRKPLDFDTPVLAAETGVVHKVFGLETEQANVMRCGRGWESAPYYDSDGNFCGSHHNHGFGMTVIIKHDDRFFTLYAHLNCIEPRIEPGTPIRKGQKIGIMGNSAYEYQYCNKGDCGPLRGFGAHLHFEVKEMGVLCDQTDYGSHFAYVTAPPEQFGYQDPVLHLNKSQISSVDPFPVEIAKPTLLRSGPKVGYGRLTNTRLLKSDLYKGSEFVVYRKAVIPSDDGSSGTWYQIFLPTLMTVGDSEGWIGADRVVESSSPLMEVVDAPNGVNVRADPGASSRIVARVYNGQRVVFFERTSLSRAPWYRIHLPVGCGLRSGWLSGKYLKTPHSP